MKLKYLGMDNWNRPVYEDENERLWKDVCPLKHQEPDLCTSMYNEFNGEPDTNMKYIEKYEDIEIEFIPERKVWW